MSSLSDKTVLSKTENEFECSPKYEDSQLSSTGGAKDNVATDALNMKWSIDDEKEGP